MTDPVNVLAGGTHDIVVHVNDSQRVGLIVKPFSYRVSKVPTFTPRFAAGDVAAHDLSWLRSYRITFDRGAGSVRSYDPSQINQYHMGWNVVSNPEGELTMALQPTQTSSLGNAPMRLTTGRSMFMFEMSRSPHLLVESLGLHVFSSGQWVVAHTNRFNVNLTNNKPLAAIMHSDTAFFAMENSGIIAYGRTGGNRSARVFVPTFSNTTTLAYNFTQVTGLYNYDKRLWKIQRRRVAYWDAGTSRWSDWIEVGDHTTSILNTETFIGRKFFGKEDGLWVFDAGRVYQIEDYKAENDVENFSLMKSYRGALYYNIRKRLLRYTAGGAIEEIPWTNGEIDGGEIGLGGLLIHGRDEMLPGGTVWHFNPDTGAISPILGPRWVGNGTPNWDFRLGLMQQAQVHGDPRVWIAPFTTSQSYSGQVRSPVAYLRSAQPPYKEEQENPFNAGVGFFETPEIDFGVPGLTKHIVRIKVYYRAEIGTSLQIRAATTGRGPLRAEVTYIGTSTDNFQDNAGGMGTVPNTDRLIVASTTPVWRVNTIWRPSTGNPVFFDWPEGWEYETASAVWAPLTLQSRWLVKYFPNGELGVLYYRHIDTFVPPTDWAATLTHAGKLSYHLRRLNSAVTQDLFVVAPPWAVKNVAPVSPLNTAVQFPHLIGTVTIDDTGDVDQGVAELEISPPLAVDILQLRGVLRGLASARFIVRALEIEYSLPETNKLQVTSVVVGTNDIKILDGSVENSAQYISTTLFSLFQGAAPHVVQLPFPFPVAHTRRMVLQNPPPGASVPVLSYDNSFIGAEYSLQMREV